MSVTDQRPSDAVRSAAKRLAAASAAGLVGGLLLGGVGGRLAMLVLRLTSDPNLHGLETDDGFTIGIVSGATVFLVGFTALLGVMGGVFYLVVRSWLPERARPWLFGALTGLVGGAEVIRPGGIDFTLLDPLWLAVTMFVLLPAGYGVVVSFLAERFLRSDSRFQGSRAALVMGIALTPFVLLLLAGFGPVGVAILIAAVVALVVWARAPHLASVWSSRPIRWLGRGLLLAVGVGAAIVLVGDVAEIL